MELLSAVACTSPNTPECTPVIPEHLSQQGNSVGIQTGFHPVYAGALGSKSAGQAKLALPQCTPHGEGEQALLLTDSMYGPEFEGVTVFQYIVQ